MSEPIELVVRQAGAGFIALVAVGAGATNLLASSTPQELPLSSGVVMPDPSLCIGCLTCEVICSRVHREQGLSDIPRIRIFNDEATVTVTGVSTIKVRA